jgi:hypothetical protein
MSCISDGVRSTLTLGRNDAVLNGSMSRFGTAVAPRTISPLMVSAETGAPKAAAPRSISRCCA